MAVIVHQSFSNKVEVERVLDLRQHIDDIVLNRRIFVLFILFHVFKLLFNEKFLLVKDVVDDI
jgi:hypothetical protein